MTGFDLIEPVYRPPSEAQSLLLQVTIGCSHNSCSFCAMYKAKRYRVRSLEEIVSDIKKAACFFSCHEKPPRKIFLCDGDALSAPTNLLLDVLDEINLAFPQTSRIGIYASAHNILQKKKSELELFAKKNLRIAYLGVESGSDEVLSLIRKNVSSRETIEASLKIKEAGWKLSQIIMLGVGGREFSQVHCHESARLISETAPHFLSFLTTVVVPNTPYAMHVKQGQITPLTIKEHLKEMEDILANILPIKNRIIFRANHVSNFLPLEGVLPRDKEALLATITDWISSCPDEIYPYNDPRRL